jgi:hypothetical protein
MGDKQAVISASLSMDSCLGIFRATVERLRGGIPIAVGPRVSQLYEVDQDGYFDAPRFTALGSDTPDLSIGAIVRRRRDPSLLDAPFILMYIWDRGGDFRQIALTSPHRWGAGRASGRLVEGAVRAFSEVDSSVRRSL